MRNRLEAGAKPTVSRSERTSSTLLLEAPSISRTSSERPSAISMQIGSSGSNSIEGPFGQFRAFEKFEKLRSFPCHAGRRKGKRAQGGLVRWRYEEFGPRDLVQEHLQKYGVGIFWQKPDSSRGDCSEE